MSLGDWFSGVCFRFVHRHNLVYNTCWEDPRLDRQALDLGPDDVLAVITSAGCNTLDYALLGPRAVHAVDLNFRQNALLELKLAGIRRLDHDTFFRLFGEGHHRHATAVYRDRLRGELSYPTRRYWDRKIACFSSPRGSFYFHGTAGYLAWMVNHYIDRVAGIRARLDALLGSGSVAEQQVRYTPTLHATFWTGFVRWAMGRDATLSLLGVPRPQRLQVERYYPGGIAKFVEDRVTAVFTRRPLHDNYFWRVYLTGRYSRDCCPEYLKPENFARLQGGLAERVRLHTTSLLEFLGRCPERISHFVLLDHMDWLSTVRRPVLQRQWQALVEKAAPTTRLLWRSGGLRVEYVDPIEVTVNRDRCRLGERLTYHTDLANRLHAQDRVNTYGSFYVADLSLN